MLVKAAPGIKVPVEGRAKSYITGPASVRVPDTAYYRRMVDEKSLIEVVPEPQPPKPSPKARKTSKRSAKR